MPSHDSRMGDWALCTDCSCAPVFCCTFALLQDDQVPNDGAVLQQFTIPSLSNLVGCYSTTRESPDLGSGLHDSLAKPTELGGCVIVTSTAVDEVSHPFVLKVAAGQVVTQQLCFISTQSQELQGRGALKFHRVRCQHMSQ